MGRGPPRAKRDGVIAHISKRENVNRMKKIPLLRDRSICHPAWLGKLGVNMNLRQFLGVICGKNLRESGILSLPWGPRKYLSPIKLDIQWTVEVISRFWNVIFWRQYRNWLTYTWDQLGVVLRVSFNGGCAYTHSFISTYGPFPTTPDFSGGHYVALLLVMYVLFLLS